MNARAIQKQIVQAQICSCPITPNQCSKVCADEWLANERKSEPEGA